MAKSTREKLIEAGHLTPSPHAYTPGDRPPMSTESVLKLRARLVKAGLIKPSPWRH